MISDFFRESRHPLYIYQISMIFWGAGFQKKGDFRRDSRRDFKKNVIYFCGFFDEEFVCKSCWYFSLPWKLHRFFKHNITYFRRSGFSKTRKTWFLINRHCLSFSMLLFLRKQCPWKLILRPNLISTGFVKHTQIRKVPNPQQNSRPLQKRCKVQTNNMKTNIIYSIVEKVMHLAPCHSYEEKETLIKSRPLGQCI